jgi:hypothetical protein
VQAQFVDEALLKSLADDVSAAHDHDTAVGRGRPCAVDRGDQVGSEGEAHAQVAL